jgi:hypothetical protein
MTFPRNQNGLKVIWLFLLEDSSGYGYDPTKGKDRRRKSMTSPSPEAAELRKKRLIAIERFILRHPKCRLGKEEYTFDIPFAGLYEIVDEYSEQSRSRLRAEVSNELHKLADKNGAITRKDIHDLANELATLREQPQEDV